MPKINMDVLCQIVTSALDAEDGEVTENTTSDSIDSWDSLGHIRVLLFLQEHFGDGYVESPEIASAVSVKEIHKILNETS